MLWALEEMGATVEIRSLGVRPRLQEPEYLAINPAGTLPALIDGERAIYELLAICEYLAARHDSDLLVAPDEPERPEFQQWLLYGEATLQAPMSAMARVGRIRNKTPEMQAGIDAVHGRLPPLARRCGSSCSSNGSTAATSWRRGG